MDIKSRKSAGTTIVDLSGRLDTTTSPAAESAISALIDEGHRHILINLADTEYLSSSGLRVLLVTAKKISALQGVLKLCQPNEVVREILDISGFSTILDVRATEAEALSEF